MLRPFANHTKVCSSPARALLIATRVSCPLSPPTGRPGPNLAKEDELVDVLCSALVKVCQDLPLQALAVSHSANIFSLLDTDA